VQTLRYYERRGLLREPPRRHSGYRTYSTETVAVVRFIQRAQAVGFTRCEIETMLHLAGCGATGCEAVKKLAQEKLRDLESRMESLRAMHDSLLKLADTCGRPARDRDCPLIKVLSSAPNGTGI
jgi:DNA-binding transcriptional MerR regulator